MLFTKKLTDLPWENACYQSFQNLLSSFLLSKIERLKYVKEHNFTSCFVWVWNFVSHTKEEHRLKVSENRVLRRIFGPQWEEVEGGWRRLHNEELHNLYTSPNIVIGS
jgi:hypothetical protein